MDDKSKTCNSIHDPRPPISAALFAQAEDISAELIAATVDVVLGKAIVVDDDLGVIEVAAPRMMVVTWKGREWKDGEG